MPLILIIEDDITTRVLHVHALSDVVGATVLTAGSLAEARDLLAQTEPDLVLLDLRLQDGTALDLLDALAALPKAPRVMVVSAFPEDLPQAAAEQSGMIVLKKPVSPTDLRCRVLECLQLARPESPFSLAEYAVMACLGRHSLVLLVLASNRAGFVAVKRGEIWAASFGRLRGLEALSALAKAGPVSVEARPWPSFALPRQLAGGHQEILREASRRAHEPEPAGLELSASELDFTDLLDRPPPAGRHHAPSMRPHGHEASALIKRGVEATIARRYADAIRLFDRALSLQPDNTALRYRLERLRELGHDADAVTGRASDRIPKAG